MGIGVGRWHRRPSSSSPVRTSARVRFPERVASVGGSWSIEGLVCLLRPMRTKAVRLTAVSMTATWDSGETHGGARVWWRFDRNGLIIWVLLLGQRVSLLPCHREIQTVWFRPNVNRQLPNWRFIRSKSRSMVWYPQILFPSMQTIWKALHLLLGFCNLRASICSRFLMQ